MISIRYELTTAMLMSSLLPGGILFGWGTRQDGSIVWWSEDHTGKLLWLETSSDFEHDVSAEAA